MKRTRGTLRCFDHRSGYGFIRPDDGGRDVFFHAGCLDACGYIVLELIQGDRGPVARRVCLPPGSVGH